MKSACITLAALVCAASSLSAAEEANEAPWYTPVKNYQPPKPGEHPRLLFRRGDLDALKKKAKTPEGKAILKRLRFLLDGKNGETMTTVFQTTKDGGKADTPGVYTMGHMAGYGLLYQLTGQKKYAEFGRQCFEKALAGQRDRDLRYSFRKPGGPLRAGPALGWYAVGYDLCHDGWDPATREKLGRSIAEYREDSSSKAENLTSDLEVLAYGTRFLGPHFLRYRIARGTPPSSNHFSLQVGGAALALLAISNEKWVDQKRIDTLLTVNYRSMIRNVTEGFGDGGFFAEGDGTGSMASQIAYLPGLQAWKNAAGKDFVNVKRPNVRMTTLKWIYLTIIRDGKPDFWPIRGRYPHNVWSRTGLSGAGYFAIGFGGVPRKHQAAMKWYYERFLAKTDAAAGQPCDTASVYPHLAVSAFVNWPVDVKAKNPAEVLPLCYRDSLKSFYAWRNRWKDQNDTVISVLLEPCEGYGGYRQTKVDKTLYLNTMGKHIQWGKVAEGKAKYWWSSPMGQTSSLTMADGTCLAVDFTGASGADVMLVTTAQAKGQTVKIDGKALTFYFPTSKKPPTVKVEGKAAIVGKQRITLKGGHLVLATQGS